MLTKEQIEQLAHLEQNFFTALNLNYKRQTTKVDNLLVLSILEQVTGRKQSTNLTCPTCILKLYKGMADIYFKSKKALESAAKEVVDTMDDLTQEEAPEPKKTAKKKATKKAAPKKKKTERK